ncbi:winged helix DNA-binding domain-containing protein [Streptomyces sp. NPDC020807]|uniref:winged helix DNA-binding domain-containing protein n=1 Tax=Streptomyces sp. NPDC020807 TaxID=3155119 RepID=UPI0033F2E776
MTIITERVLNRSTLARQLLLERAPVDVEEALRRVVALQAQQPGSPYVALWNRVAGFDAGKLDAAVEGYRAVRSTLMRLTLHLVHAEDYRAFRAGMEPTLRGSRLGDHRFRAAGFTPADADALLPGLLAYAGSPRSGAEMLARIEEERGGPVESVAWRMIRQYAPLWHAPQGPPWQFGTPQSFVTARPFATAESSGEPPASRELPPSGAAEAEALPDPTDPDALPDHTDPDTVAAGLAALVLRYLEGFGPASVADMAQFSMTQRGRVRKALAALGGLVTEVGGPGGTVLYDTAGAAPLPDADTPAPPRLMAMWDSVLLAYADRGRVIPPAYRKAVIRVNGDVLPTLLVDGYVAGVWRPVEGGIEVSAFHPLPAAVREELGAEAEAMGSFLAGRDPLVYRRYDHWWAKGLPIVESTVVPTP